MGGIASLQLCNMVSRGVPMAEARKRLGLGNKSEPVKAETKPAVAPAPTDFDEKKALQDELKALKVKFSPNAGIKVLKEKLAKAREEEDTL